MYRLLSLSLARERPVVSMNKVGIGIEWLKGELGWLGVWVFWVRCDEGIFWVGGCV